MQFSFGQSLVPRPIICQNFVLERIFLKNTRFTVWGASMPVSIMSTDMAMCGSESGSLNCLMSSCA